MRFLMFFFFMLSVVAHAETLPSLPALDEPSLGASTMGDPTFARNLEKLKDYNGAILEWQRIAHVSFGAQQAYALMKIGQLALKEHDPKRARPALERFMTTFPKHKRLAESLYLLSLSVSDSERPSVLRLAKRMVPDSPWTTEAVYHAVWDYAQTHGSLPNRNYADTRTSQLAQRLQALEARYPHPMLLQGLSFIPGALHLWFAKPIEGALYALILFLLLWVISYAVYKRQWPYATWWLFILCALVLTTHSKALALIQTLQHQDRVAAMASWEDLQPKEPTDK